LVIAVKSAWFRAFHALVGLALPEEEGRAAVPSSIRPARGVCSIAAVCGLAAFLCAGPVAAETLEETISVPVTVADRDNRLISRSIVVTVFREPGRDRYPLLVLNHGRAPYPEERSRLGRVRYGEVAVYFASLGFEVMVPTRIGYGESGGEDVEDTGSCANKLYPPGYEAAAQQVMQVMAAAAERPEVDMSRVVVVGQSFGGATAIAVAAKNPAGVRLVVNFAGGGGGNPFTRPGAPCGPERLTDLFAGYGRTARVPTLWIYTANDRYMGTHPRQWFDAFVRAGGIGEFKAMPAFRADGHQLFSRGLPLWRPVVDEALRGAGFAVPKH
jgi:dienelactone hydrolase